jgi:energy-coupling factor transporter transmembrane protein EcfT
MDMVIDRGQKIEVLVKRSENLSDQSYEMRSTAKTVKNRMWWKNKKIMIGAIILVLVVIGVIVLIVVLAK